MGKCFFCKRDIDILPSNYYNDIDSLPYNCKYCGNSFCSNHRLPENHDCTFVLIQDIETEKKSVPLKYADVILEKISSVESKSNKNSKNPPEIVHDKGFMKDEEKKHELKFKNELEHNFPSTKDDLDEYGKLIIHVRNILKKHPSTSLNYLIDSIPELNYSKLDIIKEEFHNFQKKRKKRHFFYKRIKKKNAIRKIEVKFIVKIAFFLACIILGFIIPIYNPLSLFAFGILIIGFTGFLNNTLIPYFRNRRGYKRPPFNVGSIYFPDLLVFFYIIGILFIILSFFY